MASNPAGLVLRVRRARGGSDAHERCWMLSVQEVRTVERRLEAPPSLAGHVATSDLMAICGGILLSCLRVHAGELFRVTNVVNPSNFLYVFPSDCYKRRQSARYFAGNRVFWAWIDDVCNKAAC